MLRGPDARGSLRLESTGESSAGRGLRPLVKLQGMGPQPANARDRVYLGTSSFTAAGWEKSFYSPGLDKSEYLRFYAQEFPTVELDVTFYRVPTARMIQSWYAKTPPAFTFAVKAPQAITHEKTLVGCREEMEQFIGVMQGLREKLGPVLLQFPYFSKNTFSSSQGFLARLDPFLASLPKGPRYAVEIRNKWWISPVLMELLRGHGVAFALIDHPWMHPPKDLFGRVDPLTTDFTYIRWLGDRKAIEEQTDCWDGVIVDRTAELGSWVDICQRIRQRGVTIYGYINNHYSGHAPATVRKLLQLFPQLPSPQATSVRPAS